MDNFDFPLCKAKEPRRRRALRAGAARLGGASGAISVPPRRPPAAAVAAQDARAGADTRPEPHRRSQRRRGVVTVARMMPWLRPPDDDGDDLAAVLPAPPPPVRETFAFGAPATPDAPDAAVNLATLFAVTAAGLVVGIAWQTPTVAPGVVPVVQLWNKDTATLLAQQTVGAVVPGTVQQVLFAAPAAVVPGVNYHAQVWTDRYAFTAGYGWPVATANMHSAAVNPAAFLYDPAPQLAIHDNGNCYFVGPIGQF